MPSLMTEFITEPLPNDIYDAIKRPIRPSHAVQDKSQASEDHRNRLSPAFKLPPELLCHIFKYCSPKYSSPWTTSVRWFNFSQVCHLWRQVAVADPSLWVIPCLSHVEIAQQMVSRAWALPLDVVLCRLDVRRRREAAEYVLTKKTPAMKTLTIWANEDDLAQMLTVATNQGPATSLHSMRLRCNLPHPLAPGADRRQRSTEPGCLPELNKLLAASPSIHELELQCCMPQSPCERLAQLTSLVIDNSFVSYAQRPTIDMLVLLHATPMLTHLTVSHALAPPPSQLFVQGIPVSPPTPRTSHVDLPQLVHLSLSDDLYLITDTLPLLSLPLLAHFEMHNTDYHAPSSAALEDLVAYLASQLCSLSTRAAHALDIKSSLHGLTVTSGPCMDDNSQAFGIEEPHMTVDLHFRMKDTQIPAFIELLAGRFSLRTVEPSLPRNGSRG